MQVLIISWLIFISKKIEGRIESKMSEMDSAIKTVTFKVQYFQNSSANQTILWNNVLRWKISDLTLICYWNAIVSK